MFKEYEIPMSEKVATELKRASTTSFLSKESLKLIWEVVPLGAAILSLILIVLWLFLNWLIGLIISIDFGWGSQYRNYILWPIVVLSYLYFFVETAKSCGLDSKIREALKEDLAGKILKVSEYPIIEVKVFEEPEHGGFIYFVLSCDDKVIALFDYESQDLSIDGEDPKNSSYKVRKNLKISKTPIANFIVDDHFFGEIVEIPEINVFTENTEIWPVHAEYVKCKWENVDARYSAK